MESARIGDKILMKLCLKCRNTFNDDSLSMCPKCKKELIPYSQEKYEYYLKMQNSSTNKTKEERMYDDIHTIKNILVCFFGLTVASVILMILMFAGM